VWREFFKWGQRLQHTPFGKFPKAPHHRFGVLKLWPKWKNLDMRFLRLPDVPPAPILPEEQPLTWQLIKWRPLVSYSGYYWRRLLSRVCRWCVYTMRRFDLGFTVDNPRVVARKLQEFNQKLPVESRSKAARMTSLSSSRTFPVRSSVVWSCFIWANI